MSYISKHSNRITASVWRFAQIAQCCVVQSVEVSQKRTKAFKTSLQYDIIYMNNCACFCTINTCYLKYLNL